MGRPDGKLALVAGGVVLNRAEARIDWRVRSCNAGTRNRDLES